MDVHIEENGKILVISSDKIINKYNSVMLQASFWDAALNHNKSLKASVKTEAIFNAWLSV